MSPQEDIVDALIESVLRPALSELAREARQPISVKVVVRLQGASIERLLNVESSDETSAAGGEIRVMIKDSASDGFRFSAEAIFKGLAPDTGFSGFSLQGKLKLEEGKVSSQVTSCTNRYNVWDWSRKFRVQ